MSIWIFDRYPVKPVLFLLIAVGLSACGSSRLGSVPPQKENDASVSVSGRNYVIKGPTGYCVDRQITQVTGDTAFVLLGDCGVVSPSNRAARPDDHAILTVSISGLTADGPGIRDSLISMDRFFRSETGRTALSRASDPASVEILETFQQDGMFFLRARDGSPGIVPDAAPDFWRAYFDVYEQIVSVSVIGFNTKPISPEKALSLVTNFARSIRASNLGGDTVTVTVREDPVEETTEPVEEIRPRPEGGRPLRSIGLIRRLFG
jgi:hypothetical protein